MKIDITKHPPEEIVGAALGLTPKKAKIENVFQAFWQCQEATRTLPGGAKTKAS